MEETVGLKKFWHQEASSTEVGCRKVTGENGTRADRMEAEKARTRAYARIGDNGKRW